MANRIEFKGVSKEFRSDMLRRRKTVIHDLAFEVRPGETYAILGANGAGKTTTLKMLLDLISPSKGEIRIDGRPSNDPLSRRILGFLPEQPYFLQHLTGGELIRYYAVLSGVDRGEAARRSKKLLNRLGLKSAGDRRIRTYSKGMMQRLGFAQVLVAEPEILVLDEPLSGLDPIGRREIRQLLLDQKERGRTILLSSHILEDVERVCDRAGFLVNGTIKREVDVGAADLLEVLAEGMGGGDMSEADHIADTIVRQGELVQFALRNEEDFPKVQQVVQARGGRIVSVNRRRKTLEDLFVENVSAVEDRD